MGRQAGESQGMAGRATSELAEDSGGARAAHSGTEGVDRGAGESQGMAGRTTSELAEDSGGAHAPDAEAEGMDWTTIRTRQRDVGEAMALSAGQFLEASGSAAEALETIQFSPA